MSKVNDFVQGRRVSAGVEKALDKLEKSVKAYVDNIPQTKHETPFGEEFNRPEPVTTVGKPKRLVDRISELDELALRVRLYREAMLIEGKDPYDEIEDDGVDPEDEFESGMTVVKPQRDAQHAEPKAPQGSSADVVSSSDAQAADQSTETPPVAEQ